MKWFNDLKIANKLAVGFGMALFAMLALGTLAVTKMREVNASVGRLAALQAEVDVAGDLQLQVANVWQFITDACLTKDQSVIDTEARPSLEAAQNDIDKMIVMNGHDPIARARLTEMKEQLPLMFSTGQRMFDAYRRDWDQGNRVMDDFDKVCDAVIGGVGTISADVDREFATDVAEAQRTVADSTVMMSILIGVAFVVASSIAILTARAIAKPLKTLTLQAESIATGDLTVEVVQRSKDEIGHLSGSFRTMVEHLRETIGQVREASHAVSTASCAISSSSEEMATGANEQAKQAGEVASAVEEMTSTIVLSSRNAAETAETAEQAKQAAELGGQVVEETLAGMKRIAGVVKESAGTVQELGKSSNQIGAIVSVIGDIADQTNLLALNAAIEAARAGDTGRGFAVVADEVRELAERTTKATNEIESMIRKIQSDAKGAVVSMEQGTVNVDEGMHLADKAGASLHQIVDISQKVTAMITQIAAASEQQSSASEQISRNVEGISAVIGETAEATQQIARAAEDLNRLTETLEHVVAKFKLPSTGSTGANLADGSGGSRGLELVKSGPAAHGAGRHQFRNAA